MRKVFCDTDICLDMLGAREPYYTDAAILFSLGDKGHIRVFVSALTISHLYYLLQKQHNISEARRIIQQFNLLVKILPVDKKIVELALLSSFKDFEDALQHFCALEAGMPIFLTRNLKDYANSRIPVMTASAFLRTLDFSE